LHDQSLVWITGATEGIGLGLARSVPYPDARVINLSRRQHPDYESVQFDLADPATWDRVTDHFSSELSAFRGRRAVLILNGYFSGAHGLLTRVDSGTYRKSVLANVAAPLALGEAFISACRPSYEAGLVLISSGAAVTCLEALSSYVAGKAAMEHWAEVVTKERENRGLIRPWVVALRLGGVDTAPVRRIADAPADLFPRAASIGGMRQQRLTPDQAAAIVWSALPPPPGVAVISLAEGRHEPELAFRGQRYRNTPHPDWKLVYSSG
jgi:NAD(P)-dependent dehydrogenase (short-subunit alcohol dehydrogenase family)